MKRIKDIDKDIIRKYLQQLNSQKKPKTVKRKMATLKAMFNFLEFEDIIQINPFRKVKIRVNEEFKLPRLIQMHEIENLFMTVYQLKNAGSHFLNGLYKFVVRDIAVIETTGRLNFIFSIRQFPL